MLDSFLLQLALEWLRLRFEHSSFLLWLNDRAVLSLWSGDTLGEGPAASVKIAEEHLATVVKTK